AKWRTTWLQFLLGREAAKDRRLAYRALLLNLTGDPVLDRHAAARCVGWGGKSIYGANGAAEIRVATVRCQDIESAFVKMGVACLWEHDGRGGSPTRFVCDDDVEALACSINLNLETFWQK